MATQPTPSWGNVLGWGFMLAIIAIPVYFYARPEPAPKPETPPVPAPTTQPRLEDIAYELGGQFVADPKNGGGYYSSTRGLWRVQGDTAVRVREITEKP